MNADMAWGFIVLIVLFAVLIIGCVWLAIGKRFKAK
jgi:hypothetical protein